MHLVLPDLAWLPVITYLTSSLLIAFISWLDDLRTVPNRIRFAVHMLSGLLVVIGIGHWRIIDLPYRLPFTIGEFGIPLTIFWIVGMTNAYNFMDGIDGLAGSQGVIAGFAWALLGWLINQPLCMVLGLLIGSASLGFLAHNWSPARIFMGDVGSAFLGFSFSVLPLLASQTEPRALLAGVVLLWVFIFDTTFTILRRWSKGQNIFTAHRSHLYQRLVIVGFSHRAVTLIYIALELIGVLLAVGWIQNFSPGIIALITIPPLCALSLQRFVKKSERHKAQLRKQLAAQTDSV